MNINFILCSFIATISFFSHNLVHANDVTKIVFVAGNRSHGWGAHEFNAGCMLMESHLKEALGEKVETVVYKNGWPKNQDPFVDADAIVLFMDGGGGHPINRNLEQVKKELIEVVV